MIKKLLEQKKDTLLVIMLILPIILVGIILVPSAKIPGTTVDEFGYLFNAANIVGWDWKELMQYHPYYGAGAGILWSPLFFLLKNSPTILYQSITIFNFALLICTYFISLYCSRKVFPDWKNKIRIISCFILIFYPCYFFYSQTALSESILYFLFWVIILSLVKIEESPNIIWSGLLAVSTCYMVIVHMRTAGIALCVAIIAVYLKRKGKLPWKNLILFGIICCIGIFAWKALQNQYFIDLGGKNDINTINTEISISGMIYSMFWHIPNLIKGIIGRCYYFMVSGNVLFFVSIVFLFKNVFKKEVLYNSVKKDLSLFLILVFTINLIAFSSQTLEDLSRLDMAVYGRYMDNIIAPILLFGFYYLTCNTEWIKYISIYIGLIIFMTIVVLYRMEEAISYTFAIDSAVGFGAFFNYDMSEYSIYLSLLKTICVSIFGAVAFSIVLQITQYKKTKFFKKFFTLCTLGIILVYWGYLGSASIYKYNFERQALYSAYETIYNIIEEQNRDKIIYLRNDVDLYGTKAKYLQFLLANQSIEVDDLSGFDFSDLNEDTIVIANAGQDFEELYSMGYEKIWDEQLCIYCINPENNGGE